MGLNGRSTQTLLSQLAREAGYTLDYGKVSASEWNRAAARSMPQANLLEPALKRPEDTGLIHLVFQAIAAPIRSTEVDWPPSAATPSTPTRGPDAL